MIPFLLLFMMVLCACHCLPVNSGPRASECGGVQHLEARSAAEVATISVTHCGQWAACSICLQEEYFVFTVAAASLCVSSLRRMAWQQPRRAHQCRVILDAMRERTSIILEI
jgi:hypothetical protein